jgi:hypothetical protein
LPGERIAAPGIAEHRIRRPTSEHGSEESGRKALLVQPHCEKGKDKVMLARTKIWVCAGRLAVLAFPLIASAPTTPAQDTPKQIGVPSNAKPEIVPSLIVLNAHGATLQGGSLTLLGVSSNAIIFADRPVRAAGHALTAHVLEEWGSGSESFGKDPPDATVSAFSKDASVTKDAVVVLTSPKLDGDDLTFTVRVLEGDLDGADGPAGVFIDIIGLPFTPLSFVSVARRTAARAAFYSAAATGAYYHPYPYPYPYPYGYPPPLACGYYPYPPCY